MDTQKFQDNLIKKYDWRFSKTMPQIPHWYLVKENLEEPDQKLFDEFAQFISENGEEKVFYSKNYYYLIIDEYKYWVIENILNRELLEKVEKDKKGENCNRKNNDFIRELDQRINSETVLFFDMDGVLIDTNYANYLSYKMAIHKIIHADISYNPNERFNRGVLKKMIPNLSKREYEKIIQIKNEFYKKHLSKTKLNDLVVDILKKYSKTNKTILVTNCREDRAVMTLK